jgi:uncharacterized protein YjbI with pentapeptide repeats
MKLAHPDVSAKDNGKLSLSCNVCMYVFLYKSASCLVSSSSHFNTFFHIALAVGKTTNFQGSILKGTRFYKAYLKDADFTGADLSTASLEDTTLEGAIFKNAVLEGAYLSASILEAKTIENVDFTDAQMPEKILKQVCQRPDLTGTNPKTGVATAESLFCE